MIPFRYHLVTIVAVFLALAVGLLGGGAFVQPALQEELENQTDRLQRTLDDRNREIGELRVELGALDSFAGSVTPYLTAERLVGTDVVVVTQPEVEDEVLSVAQAALQRAGARIVATVSATDRLVSEDAATREELASILGTSPSTSDPLSELAARRLAARLSVPGSSLLGPDMLDELLSAGFLAPVGAGPDATTLEEIGADGQVVLVLSGGRGEGPTIAPEAFGVPLVLALAELDVPVAAGESLLSDYPFVGLVRDGGPDGAVTVDDLDHAIGGIALVLGLERLLDQGVGGAYGVKDGAEPVPVLP